MLVSRWFRDRDFWWASDPHPKAFCWQVQGRDVGPAPRQNESKGAVKT